ncbi:MAG: hypothetical protein KDN22_12390 [Verrucomicrobiae bacterium]|nr:hypothetical protein [Verrucomicrobiae bacterium]
MTVIEKAFALQSVPAFADLRIQDLTAIARVAVHRQFAAGVTAYATESFLKELVVVVRGELEDTHGFPVPSVLGVASLLKDRPTSIDLCAGAEGAECLLISKGHFFTIIHQCPEIVRALVQQGRGAERGGRIEPKHPTEDALFV